LDKATIAQSAPIIITNLQGSITVSHARSGVTALDSYGSSSIIPVLAVDANGHITAAVNTAIAGLSVGVLTTGILPVTRGGTGLSGATANGQLLIGNTVSGGFDLATLTQGTNITITNDKGSITVTAANAGGGAQGSANLNFGAAPGTSQVSVAVTGQTSLVASSSIQAYIQGNDITPDHTAYEHQFLGRYVNCLISDVIAGTGFTIQSMTELRLRGIVTVRWKWS
jgi:hypothetical protein